MKRMPLILTMMVVVGIAGCKGTAQQQQDLDACQVNPTYLAVDGRWYEADGEPLDSDPCDEDDLETDGFGHKKPTTKPKVISTAKPAPRVTPTRRK